MEKSRPGGSEIGEEADEGGGGAEAAEGGCGAVIRSRISRSSRMYITSFFAYDRGQSRSKPEMIFAMSERSFSMNCSRQNRSCVW